MPEPYIQIIIAAMGGVTIWLLSHVGDLRKQRLGFIIGFFSEPIWIASAWKNNQWGIIALAFWYGYAYITGAVKAHRQINKEKNIGTGIGLAKSINAMDRQICPKININTSNP